MEMCYDGALVMPSSYAVMDEDEMTYVEGGKEYKYKKGDATGYKDCYQSAATLAYVAGISWIMGKASAACTIMAGPVATVMTAIFSLVKWVCAAFASQFFYAAETARAIYKKSSYTICVNTFLGVPTSVSCI